MTIISSGQTVIYSGRNVTATGYSYNLNASKNISAGWFDAKYTDCVIQIGAATLTKPIKYRIEGRSSNSNRAASIAVGAFSAGSKIDKLIAIDTLKTPEIRIGVGVATLNASPYFRNVTKTHNIYCKLLLTDRD